MCGYDEDAIQVDDMWVSILLVVCGGACEDV